MHFFHDTEVALCSAADLVNTEGEPDSLTAIEDLDEFMVRWPWTGSRAGDEDELAQVRRLRGRLRALWTLQGEELVEHVNYLLRDARALPQLVQHDGWGWHVHASSPDRPLATRMAVEVAMGVVDVIRLEETARLKTCAAADCDDVMVDLSRNRSKRFCDIGCGNRMAAQAYRARQLSDTATAS